MRHASLGELGELKNGVNFKADRMGRGLPLINVKDITNSHRIDVGNLALVETDVSDEMFARDGDLFFARSSVKLDGIALASKLRSVEQPAIHCGFVIRFRPTSEDVFSDYLLYLLRSPEYRERLKNLSSGAAIINISQSNLKGLAIPLPPTVVQRKIAAILSAYDDLIENNRRRMALLEKTARLLYKEWFVRLRFPGHEREGVVGGIPAGFEQKRLGDILTLKRGYDLPASDRIDGEWPIVSSSGITGFHSEKKALAPGVVTGRYGTLGEVYYIQQDYWPLNTSLYVSDFKGNRRSFAAHLLKHALAGVQSDKAAVPGLNRNVAHQLPVLCPPKALHDLFADFADLSYRQQHVLQTTNDKLTAARDLLVPRLMSGEIAV